MQYTASDRLLPYLRLNKPLTEPIALFTTLKSGPKPKVMPLMRTV